MTSMFSFKFMKKSKSVAECPVVDGHPFKPAQPSPLRRRASSADSASLEEYVKLQELRLQHAEIEQKKHKGGGHRTRRKSTGRKVNIETDDDTLYNAVLNGDTVIVKQVLSSDSINVNTYREPGWTILHHACRIGNTEVIKLLLDAGANPAILNKTGVSPLRLAVTSGNFEAAFYLIHEHGVSCQEIRDGFQDKNPQTTVVTMKKNFKHGKV